MKETVQMAVQTLLTRSIVARLKLVSWGRKEEMLPWQILPWIMASRGTEFFKAALLYWFIYISEFITNILFDHFWICVSLHLRVLIFKKLIIFLPLKLFIFVPAHCHSVDMELSPMLRFGLHPVAVPHFPLFFCLLYIYTCIYISLTHSHSWNIKSCELSSTGLLGFLSCDHQLPIYIWIHHKVLVLCQYHTHT